MIVMSKDNLFGVVIHVCETFENSFENWVYGSLLFLIGGELQPSQIILNYTLNVVIENLILSFDRPYYSGSSDGGEIGDTVVNLSGIIDGTVKNIFQLGLADVEQSYNDKGDFLSMLMWMGFNGNTERLFYSVDFGKSIKEICLPKGTVESIVRSLPSIVEHLVSTNSRVRFIPHL